MVSGANVVSDRGFGIGGCFDGRAVVDRLDITAIEERNGSTSLCLCGVSLAPGLLIFVWQQPRDVGVELVADAVDDVVGDDRAGEMMDEEEQRCHADEHQRRAEGDREVGDGLMLAVRAAQDQQQVDDG